MNGSRCHMPPFLQFAALAMLCVASMCLVAHAAPLEPPGHVVLAGGCSGVCVDPAGVVLTAKHCGAEERVDVTFPDGRKFPATRVAVSPAPEGTVAYQLPPGEYPYAPLAKSGPAVGDPVYSWGYPGDSGASFSQGVITGVAIAGGYEPSSMGEVTVYTASYCGWCQSLKQHYDQGVFKPYQFRFIDVGDAPPAGVESLPTVEFHGRRVSGYDPSNPAGLLRWLNSVARSPVKSTGAKVQLYRASVMATPGWSGGPLFDAAGSVVGLCSVSNLENSTGWIRLEDLSSVYTASISRRGPIPFSRPEGARSPADDVATLKAQLASLVKDIEEFKSAGILGKLGEIGDLKRDFAGLKASAAAARDEADKAKAEIDRLRGEGWPWWYALPFSIGGVIHRRYA